MQHSRSYYAFDTPNPTPEAKNALRGFHRIGLRHFIHQKTGWKPFAETDAVVQRLLTENAKLRARLKYTDGLPLLEGSLMLPLVEVAKIHGYQPGKERGALGTVVSRAVKDSGYQPVRSRDPHTAGLVNFYPAYDRVVVSAIASFYSR